MHDTAREGCNVIAIEFVCCALGFSSHSKIFHLYRDVTITGEGLQILTYARHLWQLSSEGSLVCHKYCDTAFVYNSHLRGHVKLTTNAERLTT